MKIRSKATIAATLMIGTMALIGLSIAWADAQVRAAAAQRRQSVEIVDALDNMRMVSFEYLLTRRDRPRMQEQIVWNRLERLFASPAAIDGPAAKILANLRSQGEASHRLFGEIDAAAGAGATDEVQRRFESQLSSHILILQQNGLVAAEQLIHDAGARIDAAQRRVVLITGLGLLVMAALIAARSFFTPSAVTALVMAFSRCLA